ncbi:hypothetical protein FB451DRAFT_1164739 [Mycena latifolia]|nr:hypothetical protein FB451DRAFT_1164739 [Mycena latifolia]
MTRRTYRKYIQIYPGYDGYEYDMALKVRYDMDMDTIRQMAYRIHIWPALSLTAPIPRPTMAPNENLVAPSQASEVRAHSNPIGFLSGHSYRERVHGLAEFIELEYGHLSPIITVMIGNSRQFRWGFPLAGAALAVGTRPIRWHDAFPLAFSADMGHILRGGDPRGPPLALAAGPAARSFSLAARPTAWCRTPARHQRGLNY